MKTDFGLTASDSIRSIALTDWKRVADDLHRQYDLSATDVSFSDRQFRLLHPRRADELIDDADFARDERLPYWAELWPAGRVLASQVVKMPGNGKRCLELGCGLGLVSMAAAAAGFCVTASDYYAEALRFVRFNTALNGLPAIETRLIDWREFPDDLKGFDLVVAADVLYEDRNSPLIATALAQAIGSRGLALVADPSRGSATSFVDCCRRQGLANTSIDEIGLSLGDLTIAVNLYAISFENCT